MRRIFSLMEEAQYGLLSRLNISLFDKRLRDIRIKALELFEQAWPLAIGQRVFSNEEDAAPLYLYCLARALSSVGVEVPEELWPRDEKIIHFLKEKFP
jgi:hypothetical protein